MEPVCLLIETNTPQRVAIEMLWGTSFNGVFSVVNPSSSSDMTKAALTTPFVDISVPDSGAAGAPGRPKRRDASCCTSTAFALLKAITEGSFFRGTLRSTRKLAKNTNTIAATVRMKAMHPAQTRIVARAQRVGVGRVAGGVEGVESGL